MKRILLVIPFLFFFHQAFSIQNYDSLLTKLNTVLDNTKTYDKEKADRIEKLETYLNDSPNLDQSLRYNLYLNLYDEYKSFNYSKAFYYVQKLQQTAHLLNDPSRIAESKVKFGFILLSSGMFKETFDSLKTVNVKMLNNEGKKDYYFLTARTYYDLSDFDKDDYYTPIYIKRAGIYIDSATVLSNNTSFEYIYYNGLKNLKTGNIDKAVTQLKELIAQYKLTDHQFAVTASTLSDIYIRKNEPDSAINLLIMAAMADARSSTKEAAALTNLAQLLYKSG